MQLRVHRLEEAYVLADFIADAFGPMAEVVVHDVKDLESSIVHIRNGALSGRRQGDGTTDQALRLIKTGETDDRGYVADYRGKSLNGHAFRSSTLFIKDVDNQLIGLLCVNINVTGLDGVISMLRALDGDQSEGRLPTATLEENLQGDSSETIRQIVQTSIEKIGISPKRMTKDERMEVIRRVQEEGVFLMKGAVNIVAPLLSVSIPTLYRYLQETK